MKAGRDCSLRRLLPAFLWLISGLWVAVPIARAEDSHTPLQPVDCPGTLAKSEQAACFILHVPADWGDLSHRSRELPVMRFAPLGKEATKSPLLVLGGGPGQSVIKLAGPIAENLKPFRQNRELILMDQRGTGPLSGQVQCEDAVGDDEQISIDRVAECVKAAEADAYFLSDYSTDFAVQDYRALRYSLKIDKWAIFASSYGGRVAQGLVREDEKGIDRILFNGPLFVATRFFDWNPFELVQQAIELCNEQEDCRSTYPDLYWDFQRLPFDIRKAKMPKDSFPADLQAYLYRNRLQAMLASHKLRAVPADITKTALSVQQALEQDIDWIAPSPLPQSMKGIGLLMHFAIICAEDIAPLADKSLSELDQPLQMAFYRNVCDRISKETSHTVKLKKGWQKASKTKKPVLMLNGQYDTIVNPQSAFETLKLYANGALITVPFAGHDVVSQISCARDIATKFLDGTAATKLDNTCVGDGNVAFFGPSEKWLETEAH